MQISQSISISNFKEVLHINSINFAQIKLRIVFFYIKLFVKHWCPILGSCFFLLMRVHTWYKLSGGL
jgi:hypothetical protein